MSRERDTTPYIILLGDVGTGKSTIVEKLTGVTGKSSDSSTSFTKSSEVFEIFDGSILICDTPGANPLEERFEHNIHIAHAMNFKPVTCVLIVAKADPRMENTVQSIRQYVNRLLPKSFPEHLRGVCITHMDKVKKWTKSDIEPYLRDQLSIKNVVCSSFDTSQETLRNDLLDHCIVGNQAVKLNITSDMFLKLFDISSDNKRVLTTSQEEIERFEAMKNDFEEQSKTYPVDDQMSLTFEFNAWISQQYVEAQQRFSEKNNFTLYGPNMTSEAGHIANLSNQLLGFVQAVRMKTSAYLKDTAADFRKCPHCGLLWTKVEGCQGQTTCGARPYREKSDHAKDKDKMANFTFSWDEKSKRLSIRKNEKKSGCAFEATQKESPRGCLKPITWTEMEPVTDIPDEVKSCKDPYMGDLDQLPDNAKERFANKYNAGLDTLERLVVRRVVAQAQNGLANIDINVLFAGACEIVRQHPGVFIIVLVAVLVWSSFR